MACEEDEDRLSSLTDDILHQILSLTPTKDAVKTGVLSKRWYGLWRSCINIYFTNINLEDESSILNFNLFLSQIYYVHHFEYILFNRFYIDIQYSADPNDIISHSIPSLSQWIKYAAGARVKFLHLLLNYVHGNLHHLNSSPHLPSGVLRCKTLIVLKLRWFLVKSFPFTDKVDFPELKTLHLEDINFKTHSLFMLFLAGCPVLEDLKVANVFFLEDKTDEDDQVSASLNLSNLIRADITNCCFRFPIKTLFNLEFLRIQLSPQMYTPDDFPTFHKLTHLVINNISDLVLQMLHHCPKLQNLELYQKTQSESWDNREQGSWVVPKSAPKCLSSYLRRCTIRDFALQDLHQDIMLARYILNNAGLLQTMTIWSDKEKHEIEIELSSCPRASATCQISVS
ncbi:FBD-associated F-box protein At4g10400-like [Trifolium pratense]|uniref:FBD-associated F-box protein At4g10400-like n=1 Tax=Trifolium pratense TaxID=57577 RepID=UPI001E692929|nr:FBD-associated F-box protein At4g10400-like [Trifolium pratense]